MLAAVVLCADQCAKTAFAYGRVATVVEPEYAEFYRTRYASAAARRDEAHEQLAGLPLEQVPELSPFLHPEVVQQKAEGSLRVERAAQILARDPLHDSRRIDDDAINEDRWNVLRHPLPQDASRELAEQVLDTARDLFSELIQHREASYTSEERRLWDHHAGLIEHLRFRDAGVRLTELDRQDAASLPPAELSPDQLAERVQRIIDDPTREADEHDDRVLQALFVRREQEYAPQPAVADVRDSAETSQEPEPASSGAQEAAAIDAALTAQELTDDKQVQYSRWTGEQFGAAGRETTDPAPGVGGRGLSRTR